MIDRAKMLKILVESNRRNLDAIEAALEDLDQGGKTQTRYSTLQRAFHTIKHDARHLRLDKLARLAEAGETIVERAVNLKLGLPIDLLRAGWAEIHTATETIAAGGRHQLDAKLLRRLEQDAKSKSAG